MTETVNIKKRQPKQPLLTLQAGINPEGQVDSTIPARWCVSKQLIERLKREEFKNPHLLLVVRHKNSVTLGDESIERYEDTKYYVMPITQELQFVSFSRPGDNEVVPVVVDIRNKDDAKALDTLRQSGAYADTVLNERGTLNQYNMPRRARLHHLSTNFTLEVNVPKEMFAPEPRAWTKALVGRFCGGKGPDQCGFRRRLIGSLLWVGPFMLIGTLVKLLLLILGLVFTIRQYNLRSFLHPFRDSWIGVAEVDNDNTLWWQHKNGHRRAWPFFVFNHLGVFLLPAIVYLGMHLQEHHGKSKKLYQLSYWGWWKTFFVYGGAYVGVAILAAILAGLGLLAMATNDKFSQSEKARQRRLTREEQEHRNQQTAEARRREQILRDLEAMVCSTGSPNRTPSLQALPANKRTVTLRFYDLKTKVCKPFAR